MAFARSLGLKDATAGATSSWWDGEAKTFNRNIYGWDAEDAAFYVGAALFCRRQDRGLMNHDNLGMGKNARIPPNTRKDILDFGSIGGAIIYKALTGKCFDFLDEWGWDFHRKSVLESTTRQRAREIAEQLIYLDVMADIEKGLANNGYAL